MNIISQKLETAKCLIIEEFGDSVAAIIVMGSITREATETSDLDVSVIYYDRAYNEYMEGFRDKLSQIANEINREQPQHPIVLWASKEDHYLTALPDVSYVKRNLPYTLDRLDAWGGLAKNTLLNYELASHHILYGRFDSFSRKDKTIPPYEAFELFIIATRTFAEGITELASTDPIEQRNGINHIAKAGLRAAYAVLIGKNTHPLNSYHEIFNAAILVFPKDLHSVLSYLYELKTGMSNEPNIPKDALPKILKLLYYCEKQVSTVRRLSMSGLAWGRAGESFCFNNYIGALTNDPPALSEDYCRFPGFELNFIHSLYFLTTATEIVRRLVDADFCDLDILSFFFEEIFVVVTFALYCPFGTRVQLGVSEMIELRVRIVLEENLRIILEERERLFLFLFSLRQSYSNSQSNEPQEKKFQILPRKIFKFFSWLGFERKALYESLTVTTETPWFSNNHRLDALHGLAFFGGVASKSGEDRTLPTEQTQHMNIDALAFTQVWQSRLLRKFYSEEILNTFNQFALILCQGGRKDDARSILLDLALLEQMVHLLPISEEDIVRSKHLLSTTRQYLGITYQHSGDAEQAKREYIRALELNPDNFSALDDLTSLLMLTEPNEATVKLLSELVEASINCRKESQEQVSQRFMHYAIKCKQEDNYSDAEVWYIHALKFDPTSVKAHFNYGLLLEQVGEIESAKQHYEKAIELNPQYKNAYVRLALLLENHGNFEASITLLNLAIEFGLTDERVWTNLGNSYQKSNKLELADKSFVEALRINNNYADAWNGRGVVLISSVSPSPQDFTLALVFFSQAIKLDPDFDGAKTNYFKALSQLKKSPSSNDNEPQPT